MPLRLIMTGVTIHFSRIENVPHFIPPEIRIQLTHRIPSHAECLNTNTTLSPRKNIFEIKRSLVIGFPFFPLAELGVSVHIYDQSGSGKGAPLSH